MDDNVAVSAKDSNPYISPVALTARNAYDTLHNLMSPLIKGKKSSLKQIDRWINEWVEQLERIRRMYEELLAKIKDLSSDFEGTMTLDFAKEAWEIIQDTPILRRYMGEANYWYLYDMLGLLATQSGSMAGDLATGARETIKKAILGLISMTNGLLCVESYLGMIQQYWGSLYVKFVPIPLIDSIVPNVTCAYWYKLPKPSTADDGKTHLTNDPPGKGFTPIPLAIPEPGMAIKAPDYAFKLDYQNPETWYYNGAPYYIPRTMDLLQKALNYWGSSYTDEWLPAVNKIYPRRPYGEGEDHPLITGKTFAQLDMGKNVINGSDVVPASGGDGLERAEREASVREQIGLVFTDAVVESMRAWQQAYEDARTALRQYLLDGFAAYGEQPSTITQFVALQASRPDVAYVDYNTWRITDPVFVDAVNRMIAYWVGMVTAYSDGHPTSSQLEAFQGFFDAVMSTLNAAGHDLQGTGESLEDNQMFTVVPSYAPDTMTNITDDLNTSWGECFVAYRLDLDSGKVSTVASGSSATITDDAITGTYDLGEVAFVMFPSDWKNTPYPVTARMTMFAGVAKQAAVTVVGVTDGLKIGDSISGIDGTLISYEYNAGMYSPKASVIGELPEALSKHHSCGAVIGPVFANMFFPDGNVPQSVESDVPPKTFVNVYDSFMETAMDANEELADVVGYSIDHGRETKFPCFNVYGELLSMQSWHYKEMPFDKFNAEYRKIKGGYSLYYKVSDPSNVVFYHSSYMSQARKIQIAIYHEYLEKTTKTHDGDSYTFYVYPCESVSVSLISDVSLGGALLSVDAVSPDGKQYHYTPMKNAIPKCAKYVEPEKWSIMDIIHEMYLLAANLADLCGDNGERLRTLEEDLTDFNISTPMQIYQLPENNGQYSLFRFGIFKDYADRIETLIDSVYTLRSQIIAATNTL